MLSSHSNTVSASPLSKKIINLDLSVDWDKPTQQSYKPEPVLQENTKRFVLFPIQYHDIWKVYKNAEAKFWSAEEIELDEDASHFDKLTGKEKSFITNALALLAAHDSWMGSSLVSKLSDDIQIPEARCFFGFYIMQRNIHNELFTVMFDMFTEGFSDKTAILESLGELTSVNSKKAWVEQYITDTQYHFSTRVIASAIYSFMNQVIVLDSLLFLFKSMDERPFFPGLLRSLSKYQRDHAQYYHFYKLILSVLVNKPSQALAEKIVKDFVRVEGSVLHDLLNLVGGNVVLLESPLETLLLSKRLEYHADQCLVGLGFDPVFKTKDPLPWIELIFYTEAKKDDIEHGLVAVSNKQSAPTPKKSNETTVFSLDEDF